MSDGAPALPLAPELPDVDDVVAPSAETLAAFEAWLRTHPAAPSMGRTDHAQWVRFQAEYLLSAMRARPASGGAPPATSTLTLTEREF